MGRGGNFNASGKSLLFGTRTNGKITEAVVTKEDLEIQAEKDNLLKIEKKYELLDKIAESTGWWVHWDEDIARIGAEVEIDGDEIKVETEYLTAYFLEQDGEYFRHRKSGPAIIMKADHPKEKPSKAGHYEDFGDHYYVMDKKHREDGPATDHYGNEFVPDRYYFDDEEVSKRRLAKLVKRKNAGK